MTNDVGQIAQMVELPVGFSRARGSPYWDALQEFRAQTMFIELHLSFDVDLLHKICAKRPCLIVLPKPRHGPASFAPLQRMSTCKT
eukprot:CAMPEP_0194751096 /NCGR_PEP_ID=MMETSP0323_2-20130528/5203_1 /TAXON_ID=2866 ORGANISM="Crypthecodinium cohnii, Strain Seligo" /NCGR_SAMPLE_ID=MMETSP0323_2 /ASSEMBLY_ACC=CAM_ASM_000346 /LENGTH=85 /DNA_ID=CAMNT_0039667405 /DNA_START=346 /DNA_END=599 /DNA_ORIENTATION=-